MIKLSNRLQVIANEINTKTMADIGTDHGFLPIYLWENKKCEKVIMCDVSKGSLEKAKENCKHYYPNEEFDLRLGDGLQIINCGEVDTVVMAGMGSPLIAKLLGEDIEKSRQFKKIIIQPRRHEEYIRKWLDQNCFEIKKEILVKERNRICEVIVVSYNPDYVPMDLQEDLEYKFPDSLIDNRVELTLEYFKHWLTKSKRNLEFAQKGNKEDDITYWTKAINRLEGLIERGKNVEI